MNDTVKCDQCDEMIDRGIKNMIQHHIDKHNLQYRTDGLKSWLEEQREKMLRNFNETAERLHYTAQEGSTLDLIWKGKFLKPTTMVFKILGIPKPKQSMKFTKKGFSYQPKEVVEMERNLKYDIKSQLPPDHVPYDCPLSLAVQFVFPPPKGWSHTKMMSLRMGAKIYKDTKPDLQDNLMKGVCDAMEGIVYVNDSRICRLEPSEKIYGLTPMTIIKIQLIF